MAQQVQAHPCIFPYTPRWLLCRSPHFEVGLPSCLQEERAAQGKCLLPASGCCQAPLLPSSFFAGSSKPPVLPFHDPLPGCPAPRFSAPICHCCSVPIQYAPFQGPKSLSRHCRAEVPALNLLQGMFQRNSGAASRYESFALYCRAAIAGGQETWSCLHVTLTSLCLSFRTARCGE